MTSSSSDPTKDLMIAILAIDSYHRDYNAGLSIESESNIGSIEVVASKGDVEARGIGFYARAYQLPSGEKVISYRATEEGFVPIVSNDVNFGYGLAVGQPAVLPAHRSIT